MFLGKTKDTWKKELVDLFFACLWITVSVASLAVLMYGVSIATGQRLQDTLETSGKIFIVIVSGLSVWRFLLHRKNRRVVLLDLRRLIPFSVWQPITVAGFAIVATGAPHLAPYLGCSVVMLLVTWSQRLLILEDGIWVYSSLLKWQDIQSYEWQEKAALILKLQPKRRFLGFLVADQRTVFIPAGQREAVSQLLEQYVVRQTESF